MRRALSALVLTGAAIIGLASAPAQTGADARINRIVVYGNDPCPRGADGDIVICARRPDNQRYRIPEALRDGVTAEDRESISWAAQAESLEYVGRTGIQSCSTVGPGGSTGCWAEMMRAARNDRRVDGEAGR